MCVCVCVVCTVYVAVLYTVCVCVCVCVRARVGADGFFLLSTGNGIFLCEFHTNAISFVQFEQVLEVLSKLETENKIDPTEEFDVRF